MTCLEKLKQDRPECVDKKYMGGAQGCPHNYGYLPQPDVRDDGACTIRCAECWNREIPGTEPSTPVIKDSGERRQFNTGAVRDIQEGKGRCDLMPLDVVAKVIGGTGDGVVADAMIDDIGLFQQTGDVKHLYYAIKVFTQVTCASTCTMLLEVSKHFEEGAKKYGENNWQKGIPVKCYINSAVRHYLKWLRGDKDEPHDRAFCWNIMCAIWTCKHKPELNDYAVREEIPGQMSMNTCITCGAFIPEKWQYCDTCWENLNGGG